VVELYASPFQNTPPRTPGQIYSPLTVKGAFALDRMSAPIPLCREDFRVEEIVIAGENGRPSEMSGRAVAKVNNRWGSFCCHIFHITLVIYHSAP
jgi:hypothetical protein